MYLCWQINLKILNSVPFVDFGSDFTNVDWITVTFALSVTVDVIRILPGLGNRSVVPDVTLVRKTVCYESELSLFHVLQEEKMM